MEEIIQIKCPFCGAVLSVKGVPEIGKKNVTCPICRHTYPFIQFKQLNHHSDDSHNEYLNKTKNTIDSIDNSFNETTEYGPINFTLGQLKLLGTDITYQLHPGRNIIGRKCKNGTADFQIDTGNQRAMSRQHLMVDVRKEKYKGFVHYISLCKENVNPTTIDGAPLYYGIDCMILNHGSIIKLPDAQLKFLIPDEEATEI